jgi:hypothetical protein
VMFAYRLWSIKATVCLLPNHQASQHQWTRATTLLVLCMYHVKSKCRNVKDWRLYNFINSNHTTILFSFEMGTLTSFHTLRKKKIRYFYTSLIW